MRSTIARIVLVSLGTLLLCGCANMTAVGTTSEGRVKVEQKPFGTVDGKPVSLFTLTNAHGMRADITNYGGIVVRLIVPDRSGKFDDVVLGYDDLAGYLKETPYFGALIGRYGNRIAKGKFTLDGKQYTLAVNNPPDHPINALHGGRIGFDKVIWSVGSTGVAGNTAHLELTYLSKDGEEDYPGNLTCRVTYSLTNQNELRIEYRATTDKPTPINLTNHSYWNLAGQGSGDILGHEMMINAAKFTPVDETLIPTGQLPPVEGTPFDFRKPVAIGAHINDDNQQIKFGGGIDHNFVLTSSPRGGDLALAARVHEPKTGRVMEVLTTEPGIQFYTGNFLDGSITGKQGRVYKHRYGFCLETQHFPDSPNHANFPSTILKPGQEYRTKTVYKFSAK